MKKGTYEMSHPITETSSKVASTAVRMAVDYGSALNVTTDSIDAGELPFTPLPLAVLAELLGTELRLELSAWATARQTHALSCFSALHGKTSLFALRHLTASHGVAPIRRRLVAYMVNSPYT